MTAPCWPAPCMSSESAPPLAGVHAPHMTANATEVALSTFRDRSTRTSVLPAGHHSRAVQPLTGPPPLSMSAIGRVLAGRWLVGRHGAGMHGAEHCHDPREGELCDVVDVADQVGPGRLEEAQAARVLGDENALHVADVASSPHRAAHRIGE